MLHVLHLGSIRFLRRASLSIFLLSMSTSLGIQTPPSVMTPAIVYTIAGSDSGGGAGIQADLQAFRSLETHGCSAITCLTAQNSRGVNSVHFPPSEFLKEQLETLWEDLPARGIKIGMLGNAENARVVGAFLRKKKGAWIVLDPVMISTSGAKLISKEAKEAMIEEVFPHVDVLTPNKFEAEDLLGVKLKSWEDVEEGARKILEMGVKSVIVKGGHYDFSQQTEQCKNDHRDLHSVVGYAQDYFISKEQNQENNFCDSTRGVWLRSPRYDTTHTHGTGCTLSASMAACLALGDQKREEQTGSGAEKAIGMLDACCLAKAYVTMGVARGVPLGSGPGPVVHTHFPNTSEHFPSITLDPNQPSSTLAFSPMNADTISSSNAPTLGKILPLVDDISSLQTLASLNSITDIQLRIKDPTLQNHQILSYVQKCNAICSSNGVRLWINDYWQQALEAKCYGVHLGQEDLLRCFLDGGLALLQENHIALGLSTHSFAELSVALGLNPSYVSLGPIFQTKSKMVAFEPQGCQTIKRWRALIPKDIPLVVIGGIDDANKARQVREAGADTVALIGALKNDSSPGKIVDEFIS